MLYRRILRTCLSVDKDVAVRSLLATSPQAIEAHMPKEGLPAGRERVTELVREVNGNADWYVPNHDNTTTVSDAVRAAFRSKGGDTSAAMSGMKYCSQVSQCARQRVIDSKPALEEWANNLTSRQITDFRHIFDIEKGTVSKSQQECLARAKLQDTANALLLVAHPLIHGEFTQTVMAVWIHDNNGTVALVLNVPSNGKNLRYGGPVDTDCCNILLQRLTPDKHFYVGGGIGSLARDTDSVDEVPEVAPEGTVTVQGIAAWAPGQLLSELESGTWLVAESTGDFADILFSAEDHTTEEIYRQVLLRMECNDNNVAELTRITRATERALGCLDMDFQPWQRS